MKILHILALAAALVSTSAIAGDHEGWSKRKARRSSHSGAYLWENRVEASEASLKSDGESETLHGTGVGAGLGTEFDGWVRVEGYGLYRNLSNGTNDALFGPGGGLSLELSFASPIVNLNFGIGAEASSLARQTDGDTTRYAAQGGYASVRFERFIAQQVSLYMGGVLKRETMKAEGAEKSKALDSKSLTVGATFWMY